MIKSALVLVVRDTVLGDSLDQLSARLASEGVRVVRGIDVAAHRRRLESAVGAEDLAACTVLVSTPRHAIDDATLALAPRLRSIVLPTIGMDSVDAAAAARRGVTVANSATPQNFESLAEATVLLMLQLLRAPRDAGRAPRRLGGKTVGLLGFGRVGRAVASRLRGWDVQILAHAPTASAMPDGVRAVDFETLLARSDILSVHSTLNATSRHLIDANALMCMKPGAWLLNTARGGLVDEEALCDALKTGRLAGAAIDVFETEPLPANSRLRTTPHALLTPHMVGHTRELYQSLADAAHANVAAALAQAGAH